MEEKSRRTNTPQVRFKKNPDNGEGFYKKRMDWAGIEPAASPMPRERSTTDLPARSTIVERHWLKELFLAVLPNFFFLTMRYTYDNGEDSAGSPLPPQYLKR